MERKVPKYELTKIGEIKKKDSYPFQVNSEEISRMFDTFKKVPPLWCRGRL